MKANWISVLTFIGPSVVLLMIFLVAPIFISLFMSFTNFNVYAMTDWSRAKFVGFDNFVELFQDELFWKALWNTFYCLIIALPVTVGLALLGAVLLNRETTKFKAFFKTSFFLPFVTNTVAISIVWTWIFNPTMVYSIGSWASLELKVQIG